ncbi:hypothetical protein WDW86_15710 [Bdellovibrionota bacterium FG-2]
MKSVLYVSLLLMSACSTLQSIPFAQRGDAMAGMVSALDQATFCVSGVSRTLNLKMSAENNCSGKELQEFKDEMFAVFIP